LPRINFLENDSSKLDVSALVVEDPYKNDLKSFGARLSSFLIAFSPSTLASCRSWASVGWWTEQQRG